MRSQHRPVHNVVKRFCLLNFRSELGILMLHLKRPTKAQKCCGRIDVTNATILSTNGQLEVKRTQGNNSKYIVRAALKRCVKWLVRLTFLKKTTVAVSSGHSSLVSGIFVTLWTLELLRVTLCFVCLEKVNSCVVESTDLAVIS